MKSLAIWLLAAVLGYGGLGAGYHAWLTAKPRRVLVVVDSSFAMRPAWSSLDRVLDETENRRYAEFSLFTEKSRIHGWSARFKPGSITPYAPRSFDKLRTLREEPEFDEASEILFLTNAAAAELGEFDDWTVVRP